MYNKFFGFKERPFQLLPNPAYLFLARSHEEAMAHLTYAITQGDGFVEITGEVGTGKTTLCRAFLESLDKDTEVAYIFNPKMDSIQLLKAINDEFGIPSDADNTKDLIDTLNRFLIEKKTQGKKVIILIDEAQNLSKDVLEQIRLLSNLETSTSKLLQIILVGQPELGEMLDSYELRQLGQRISLSCHLLPLTYKETRDYINHRIHIASQNPDVSFTRGAFREIYKYSKGIPRLINIVCDRALLCAFGLNRKRITRAIVRSAIKELTSRGELKSTWMSRFPARGALIILGISVIFLGIIYYKSGYYGKREIPGKKENVHEIIKGSKASLGTQKDTKNKPLQSNSKVWQKGKDFSQKISFSDILSRPELKLSRSSAMRWVITLWGGKYKSTNYIDTLDDDSFFRFCARQNGFKVKKLNDPGFDLISKLNLPAIIKFSFNQGDVSRYMALKSLKGDKVVLLDDKGREVVGRINDLKARYTGVAYVLWKDFLNFPGIIPINAPRESIIALKMLLQDLGFNNITIDPVYDDQTREAIEIIQERHGLTIDGIVGPLTKIVLYNEKRSLDIPHLSNEDLPGKGISQDQ
jgi:general secretion pathway protein A